jgi:hypothetical protein
VHRRPVSGGGSYRDQEILGEGDRVRLLVEGQDVGAIAVASILP